MRDAEAAGHALDLHHEKPHLLLFLLDLFYDGQQTHLEAQVCSASPVACPYFGLCCSNYMAYARVSPCVYPRSVFAAAN